MDSHIDLRTRPPRASDSYIHLRIHPPLTFESNRHLFLYARAMRILTIAKLICYQPLRRDLYILSVDQLLRHSVDRLEWRIDRYARLYEDISICRAISNTGERDTGAPRRGTASAWRWSWGGHVALARESVGRLVNEPSPHRSECAVPRAACSTSTSSLIH